VGEGSTVGFRHFANIGDRAGEFYRRAQPSWKLGLRFVRWGHESSFINLAGLNVHIRRPQAGGLLLRRINGLHQPVRRHTTEDRAFCDGRTARR
jgi:hypothetical protein